MTKSEQVRMSQAKRPNYKKEKKDYDLRRRYGITTEEYTKLLEKQHGCCAICNRHQNQFKKRFAVDHSHEDGKVRGLLCLNCNVTLGHLKDDKDLIKRLLTYLIN